MIVGVTPTLDVRTDAFHRAAQTLIGDVCAAAHGPALRLVSVLDGGSGMAGSDPVARDWAQSYDTATDDVLRATTLLLEGTYRVGVLLERTALNYEHAEAASTTGGAHALPLAVHPPDWDVVLGRPPSAAGAGGSDAPTGWGLVEDLVGLVWPNGHQDRLRAAASAWRDAATGLTSARGQLPAAGAVVATVRCPEVDTVLELLRGLGDRYAEVAHACGTLARACDAFADHLDEAHEQVRSELVELLAFTAGTEVVGAILSVVTFGAAEVPTQAAVAARAAVVANRVREILGGAAAAVRAVAAGIPTGVEVAESVTLAMGRLLRLRPVIAGVEDARTLPMLAKARTAATGGKVGSTAGRGKVLAKSESTIWKRLKPFRGKTLTNGERGSRCRYYEWDHRHGDIEVYDKDGFHLGSMDSATGKMVKPPVKGRRIRV